MEGHFHQECGTARTEHPRVPMEIQCLTWRSGCRSDIIRFWIDASDDRSRDTFNTGCLDSLANVG